MKSSSFIFILFLSLVLQGCVQRYKVDLNTDIATIDNFSVADVTTLIYQNPYTCEKPIPLQSVFSKKPIPVNANQLTTFLFTRYDSRCKFIISFIPKPGKHYVGHILQVEDQCEFELDEMIISKNNIKTKIKPAVYQRRKFQTKERVISLHTICTDKIDRLKIK